MLYTILFVIFIFYLCSIYIISNVIFFCFIFFFFKQKTAYELRISDWSSDVCSSDLATRLGFAMLLLTMRWPGRALEAGEVPPAPVLAYVARQLGVAPEAFADYAHRDQTRREHLVEIRRSHGFRIFDRDAFREVAAFAIPIAQTIVHPGQMAGVIVDELRRRQILLPSSSILEAVLRRARQQAEQLTYEVLTNGLLPDTLQGLAHLLARRTGHAATWLPWLRNTSQMH